MEIKNRKANFEYQILETYTVGIVLYGQEVKSIRNSEVSISEGYCYLNNGELFLKNSYVAEYKMASWTSFEIEERRDRKLLITKKEIKSISEYLQNKGLSLIPLKLFINDKGKIKLIIGIGKGKKNFDKRQSIKGKDIQRDTQRELR